MTRRVLCAAVLLCAGAAAGQPQPTPDLVPREVKVKFDVADLDNSGSLTRDEAVKGGFSSNIFAAVDSDKDGTVTLWEIATYLTERDKQWEGADTNHDGYISREEAEAAPEVKRSFDQADADHDGLLRKQEHEAWAQTTLYQNVDLPYVVPNIINKKF
jgi:Ca2+-binding EF-hand superfamily protein